MKRITIFLLALTAFSGAYSQTTGTVQSTCSANDSIKRIYSKDASRLAIRWAGTAASTYKDSVLVDPMLRYQFMQALIAVKNATTFSAVHVIYDSLKVHTGPLPELNMVSINALGGNSFMQNLQNSIMPTGNPTLDAQMSKYHLYPYTYYQGSTFDVAVLKTDTNYNGALLAAELAKNQYILSSTVIPGADLHTEITGTITSNSVDLLFNYNWGTCENGCDYHANWLFRVDLSNCVVNFLGQTGDAFNTGITTYNVSRSGAYPNPFFNELQLRAGGDPFDGTYQIFDLTGRVVKSGMVEGMQVNIDTRMLPRGMYTLSVKSGQQSIFTKVIRE